MEFVMNKDGEKGRVSGGVCVVGDSVATSFCEGRITEGDTARCPCLPGWVLWS